VGEEPEISACYLSFRADMRCFNGAEIRKKIKTGLSGKKKKLCIRYSFGIEAF
jgi:hypothetical protein